MPVCEFIAGDFNVSPGDNNPFGQQRVMSDGKGIFSYSMRNLRPFICQLQESPSQCSCPDHMAILAGFILKNKAL